MKFVAVDDVCRITLRTKKNMIMYIDNPFVMNTGKGGKGYLIFGELKF